MEPGSRARKRLPRDGRGSQRPPSMLPDRPQKERRMRRRRLSIGRVKVAVGTAASVSFSDDATSAPSVIQQDKGSLRRSPSLSRERPASGRLEAIVHPVSANPLAPPPRGPKRLNGAPLLTDWGWPVPSSILTPSALKTPESKLLHDEATGGASRLLIPMRPFGPVRYCTAPRGPCRRSSSHSLEKDSCRAELHQECGTCKRDGAVSPPHRRRRCKGISRILCRNAQDATPERRRGVLSAFERVIHIPLPLPPLFASASCVPHLWTPTHRLPIAATSAGMTSLSLSTQCLRWHSRNNCCAAVGMVVSQTFGSSFPLAFGVRIVCLEARHWPVLMAENRDARPK